MENNERIYFPSVNHAATAIIDAYGRNDYEKLHKLREYLFTNIERNLIAGSADEYHNAAVDLARRSFFLDAYNLLKLGHNLYPRDTDLLADLLCYGLHCQKIDDLKPWYDELIKINKRFWTWRAYQFSFDYLMERLSYLPDNEIQASETEMTGIIDAFIANSNRLPDKSNLEKAYMMRYELYLSQGEVKDAIDALQTAVDSSEFKAPQCGLKLTDYYFNAGNYHKAVEIALKVTKIKEDQPSISYGYLYYTLAQSQEMIAREDKEFPSESKIRGVYQNYQKALINFEEEGGRGRQCESIRRAVSILEKETGFQSNIPKDDSSDTLMRLLSQFGREKGEDTTE